MKSLEHNEQVALIQWSQYELERYPDLEYLFAIPNGGQRNAIVAKRLKDEGVKPGVSDLMLPIPVGVFHGMWIEMKVAPNKPTEDQRAWLTAMVAKGYAAGVAYDWIEARNQLKDYLRGLWVQVDTWSPKRALN